MASAFENQIGVARSINGFIFNHVETRLSLNDGSFFERNRAPLVGQNVGGEVGDNPFDWFSYGIGQTSASGELAGDGTFAYAMTGIDIKKTGQSVHGITFAVENGDWVYETASDAKKSGVSVGYYTGRNQEDLMVSASLILTAFSNGFESTDGQTASANSLRLIASGSLSGTRVLRDGSYLKPYARLLYASESLDAYSYSGGDSFAAANLSLGRVTGGVEYVTAKSAQGDQFFIRSELGKNSSNNDDITQDLTGSLGFGWSRELNSGSVNRLELSLHELGSATKDEIRLDGQWERRF